MLMHSWFICAVSNTPTRMNCFLKPELDDQTVVVFQLSNLPCEASMRISVSSTPLILCLKQRIYINKIQCKEKQQKKLKWSQLCKLTNCCCKPMNFVILLRQSPIAWSKTYAAGISGNKLYMFSIVYQQAKGRKKTQLSNLVRHGHWSRLQETPMTSII